MRYNIVFKALALVLCAAMLLTAAACGLGIFAMNEAGLYRKSWQSAYDDYRHDILEHTANAIAARYAAMELGGMTERMVDDYYGYEWYLNQFRFGTMGYTLYDSKKNPLKTYAMTGHEPAERVILNTTQQEYPKVAAVMTRQERDAALGVTEPTSGSVYHSAQGSSNVYDAVPFEGAVVTMLTVSYGDASEGVGSPDGLGKIYHDHQGFVVFQSYEPNLLDMSRRSELQSISFENDTVGLLYQITDPQGVGLLYSDENGYVSFVSDTVSPDYVPRSTEPTMVPTEQDAVPEEQAETLLQFSVGAPIYSVPHEGAEELGTVTQEDLTAVWREMEVNGALWYFGEKGWVEAVVGEPDEETKPAAVEGEGITIYAAPHRDSAPVTTLDPGTEPEILRRVSVYEEEWALTAQGWFLLEPLGQPEDVQAAAIEETMVPAFQETMEPTEETIQETTAAYEETHVAVTEPEAVPAPYAEDSETATVDPDSTVELMRSLPENVKFQEYYDGEQGMDMVMAYTLEEAPAYTVVFDLGENALNGDYGWHLLGLASNFQEYLVPGLIGSVILFAIFLVYLCCAAGHKPGTAEIRAGGLNRFPLDGWFIAVCIGLTGAAIMGVEGTEYLMRGSMEVGIAYAVAVSYAAALLIVAFFFACAAQFKTPGGYWWKYSLCGLCWKLFVICLAWCLRAGKVLWNWFVKFCKWFARTLDERMVPWGKRCCKGVWKVACVLWAMLLKWAQALLRQLGKGWKWLEAAMLRFIALLPMTWQWLLTGFGIIILLALTIDTPAAIWGICLTIAIVLYGTHAFGTLLEGVKRMNKGDLDDKVEDKLLVGSFKEFAGELNGLAGVAVVAAQKQLKSERMKTELITNVSHDIKTPLTSIINYVDLLEKPHTQEEQEVYLEVLSRQSQRLKKLIEDLMEMSKASTGNMSVDIQTVDAVEAVNQALGEFADKLDKAQLIPVFRQPEDKVEMLADGRLVWRVMSNLLGNAVKYALPGTRIYLDLNRVGDKVILSLKNISREELNVNADELLERFVRGDASRNTEGSGLGLNIAQSLMELQKGQLQLLVDGDLFKVTLIFPAA